MQPLVVEQRAHFADCGAHGALQPMARFAVVHLVGFQSRHVEQVVKQNQEPVAAGLDAFEIALDIGRIGFSEFFDAHFGE